MKLYRIIEAKLDINWLKKHNQPEVANKIIETDPTGGEYYYILTKWTKMYGTEFLTHSFRNTLEFFNTRKNLFSAMGNADLNSHTLESFKELADKVYEHVTIQASKDRKSRQSLSFTQLPGTEIIYSDDIYTLWVCPRGKDPDTINSLELLGVGTEWCTRKNGPGDAKKFLNRADIYVLYKHNKPYLQFHYNYKNDFSVKDVDDNDVVMVETDVRELMAAYRPELLNEVHDISSIVHDPHSMIAYAKSLKTKYGYPNEYEPKELRQAIIKNPAYAYRYAKYIMEKPWPEAEQIIATDSKSALLYANAFKPNRWPEAEPYIMKDPESAFHYTKSVINRHNIRGPKERWYEAEPYILEDPSWALDYSVEIMKERWPEAEQKIAAAGLWDEYVSRHKR